MKAGRLYLVLGLLALVLAAFLAQALVQEHRDRQALLRRAVAVGQYQARYTARQVADQLEPLAALAHRLAADLDAGRQAPEGLDRRLAADLAGAPAGASRMGVLFRSGISPYAARSPAGIRSYSYAGTNGTYTTRPWFQPDRPGGRWEEPHWSTDETLLVADYLEPFRLPGAAAASGLVRLEISLATIQARIETMSVDLQGYAFLASADTRLLAGPEPDLVQAGRTLADLAQEHHDPVRRRLAEAALQGRPAWGRTLNQTEDKPVFTFQEPIRAAHWTAGVSLYEEGLDLEPPGEHGALVRRMALAVALAWVALFLALGGPRLAPRRLWWVVALGTLATAAGIGLLYRHIYLETSKPHEEEVPIRTPLDLERFKTRYGRLENGVERVQASYVPTGVFLRTMELAGPNQVRLSGFIWQRLPAGAPGGLRGVVLPEALAGGVEGGTEEAWGGEVIRFQPFRITVAPEVDDALSYPFDRIRARIRLLPLGVHADTILVPDLPSYKTLAFSAYPGMDWELEVPGWTVQGDEFAYLLESYNTTFGRPGAAARRSSPELVFNVQLRREFLGPFIVAFLPLLAVAGLLFTLLLTVTQDPQRIKATGYGYLNFLRTTLTLFFTLMVAQFNIRSRIVAIGVLHLEWYYFVLYGAILAISVDALMFARQGGRRFRSGDNLLVKLAYWPALMACYFVISTWFLG